MRVLFVSFLVVIVDQVSKLLVKGFSIPIINFQHNGMYEGERIRILGNFFRITFIENPGMAFGIDPGSNFKLWISIFSILASIGIIIYMFLMKKEKLSFRFSLALILGGAIGNLIDRLFYGSVVDFLDVNFFHFTLFGKTFDRWPIFNVADAAVTIGILILLIFHTRTSSKKQNELTADNTVPIPIENETKDNIISG